MTKNNYQKRRLARRIRGQWLIGLGIVLGSLSAAPIAFAEEPTGPAIEYRPDEFPESGAQSSTVLAGAGLLVGSYGLGFATSYLWSDAPTSNDLRLPVVGPWMALAGTKCGPEEPTCTTVTLVVRSALATLSGLGQAAGLLVMAEGLFLPSGPTSGAALHPVVPGTALDSSLRPLVSRRPAAPEEAVVTPLYASPMLSETAVGFSIGGAF